MSYVVSDYNCYCFNAVYFYDDRFVDVNISAVAGEIRPTVQLMYHMTIYISADKMPNYLQLLGNIICLICVIDGSSDLTPD